MQRFTFSFLAILISVNLSAQDFYIRYNQAGFQTNAPKDLVINSSVELAGKDWKITKKDSSVATGKIDQSVTGKGKHTNFDFNYKVDFSDIKTVGNYKFTIGEKTIDFKIEANPYQKYLPEILRYLRQQRSGTNTTIDKPAGHFGDSAATIYFQKGNEFVWAPDSINSTTDILGGWYDAGDYLKFTLTSAYTTYLLLRSYEANPEVFQFKVNSTSSLNDLLDEAKWGLDYLNKCHISDELFVIQVGDNRDHELGNRLPNQDTNPHRYAYTALSRPQIAYCSAAFALASKVFSETDSSLAQSYLKKSEELFAIALKNKGSYWYQKGHEIFYADKNAYDNIQLAAAELYRVTKNEKYLDQIRYFCSMTGTGGWHSWADFNMVTHARSGEFHARSKNYCESDLTGFYNKSIGENNIWGHPHDYTWGTLYSQFGVAYSSILYKDLMGPSQFDKIPYDVIDYTFGKNNWGYSFIASKQLPNAVKNIYSQTYKLQPNLYPTGGIAEGPGDLKSHKEMLQWFQLSRESQDMIKFNTSEVVFFDDATDFQTMETTIGGLADGIFLIALISRK